MMLEDFLAMVARWQWALKVSESERHYYRWSCNVDPEPSELFPT